MPVTNSRPSTIPTNTFFNCCRRENPAPNEINLVGVPFDGLSTELSGAAQAPSALREATSSLGAYSVTKHQRYHRDKATLNDLGNISTLHFQPARTWQNIYTVVEEIAACGAIPFMVGGDHSITYGTVTAVSDYFDDLYLLHIDAHADATDPRVWACAYNHGTFIRNLLVDGSIKGHNITQIGVRDYQYHESGEHYLREQGCSIYTADVFGTYDTTAFVREFTEQSGQPVYVTFDLDSVDPAFAPGVAEHMPGGLYAREIIALLRELFSSQLNIVGADIVEFVPHRDRDGCTTALAAHLLGQMVDGLIEKTQR